MAPTAGNRALLAKLNHDRPIRRLGVTRRQLLEELDRRQLKPLPIEPYAEEIVRSGFPAIRQLPPAAGDLDGAATALAIAYVGNGAGVQPAGGWKAPADLAAKLQPAVVNISTTQHITQAQQPNPFAGTPFTVVKSPRRIRRPPADTVWPRRRSVSGRPRK